jgi:hypothetical protein
MRGSTGRRHRVLAEIPRGYPILESSALNFWTRLLQDTRVGNA